MATTTNARGETSPQQSAGRTTETSATHTAHSDKETPLSESSKKNRPSTSAGLSDPHLGVVQQVKSTASDAYESAAAKAKEKLEEQKSNLSSGLLNVAENVRKLGEGLTGSDATDGLSRITAEYSNTAADKIQQAARYFESHDVNAMYRDVENFARRNPGIFIGGTFALGFLAARFLKSSHPKTLATGSGRRSSSNRQRNDSQAREI